MQQLLEDEVQLFIRPLTWAAGAEEGPEKLWIRAREPPPHLPAGAWGQMAPPQLSVKPTGYQQQALWVRPRYQALS